jgi:hypothetical protein
MLPEHRTLLEDEPGPVPDEMLGEMYRASAHGLNELIATVSPTARALLAVCYPADDDALKAIVNEMVVAVLRRLCKDGSIIKCGATQDAQWALAPSLL